MYSDAVAQLKAEKLSSYWESRLLDPRRHPFRVAEDEGQNIYMVCISPDYKYVSSPLPPLELQIFNWNIEL